ncbi:hypothetical protein C0J50_9561 [Silurus asotus]|uniref:Uncharacterized protein n=1 Tax=Silurus asotus TaxID=30991 RepID=A0AAD5A2C5_SILAS|nr:hypothetical protein C0J50_9561 [Silurus asotus]
MEEIRKQFKRLRKFVRRRLVRLSNSERDALIQKLQDNMQNMAKDMNSLIILMTEEREKEREEKAVKDALLKVALELQEQNKFASERKPQGPYINERDTRLQQNITKFCKEKEKTAEVKKESVMTDMGLLKEIIPQLEINPASKPIQLEQEKEMCMLDKQHLQNITKSGSSLQRYDDREKTVAHEKERERRAREQKQLEERIAHLEDALDFEKRKWEQKAKLEERRNTLQLETIRELQRSLKHSEERRENAQHESDLLMNVLEQLDERVVQLKATLASEQEKQQHNQEMTYLDTKFNNETPNMSKSNKSQTISDEGQEMRMGSHGRVVEYLQMFRDLTSDLDNHEDVKEEISLDMDLRNALLQQTIAKLKSSSSSHLEQKTAAQESKDSVEL